MKVITGQMLEEVRCTYSYLAPEMLEGPGYCRLLNTWSLGKLIYTMVTGFTR